MSKINIVYDTFSGKVKKFVSKLPEEYIVRHISEYDDNSLYYFVTSTINFGQPLDTTRKFMSENSGKCLGVSSSGNKIWGKNYAKAADVLSAKYNIPIISKFELDGNEEDVEIFINNIVEIERKRNERKQT